MKFINMKIFRIKLGITKIAKKFNILNKVRFKTRKISILLISYSLRCKINRIMILLLHFKR